MIGPSKADRGRRILHKKRLPEGKRVSEKSSHGQEQPSQTDKHSTSQTDSTVQFNPDTSHLRDSIYNCTHT